MRHLALRRSSILKKIPPSYEDGISLHNLYPLLVDEMNFLAGTVFPSPPLAMDPNQIVRRCLAVKGNHNYRPEDLVEATWFLSQEGATLPCDQLIGREFSQDDSQAAVEYAKSHAGLRAIIRIEQES